MISRQSYLTEDECLEVEFWDEFERDTDEMFHRELREMDGEAA